MLSTRQKSQLVWIFSIFFTSLTSYAEIRVELPRQENGIEVLAALGGAYDETAFLGEKTTTKMTPGFSILTDNFYLDIHSISYRLRAKDNLLVKVFGTQDTLPNEEDIPSVLHIKSGDSFDAGLLLEREAGDFRAGLLIAGDVTGTYNGYKVDITGRYDIKSNDAHTVIKIGARYNDRNRSNYLFGVAKNEASTDLNAYNAADGWASFVEAQYTRQFSHNLGFVAGASVSSLSKSAQDSPRIKKDTDIAEIEVFMGLIWQFSVFWST